MEIAKKVNYYKIFKVALMAIIGTVLLTISAKIKIPFYPVPMTMQTFMVLLIGMTCGYKIGLMTVSLYLLEGIAGFPVFAGTPEKGIGFIYFTGPTMGYLFGFLFASFFAGYFKYNNIFSNFVKLVFSASLIYIFGLLWLGILIGWDKPIFTLGAKPFLLAELFKISILTLLANKITKINYLKVI